MQHCWQTTHSQHCWKLHVVSISTTSCLLLHVVCTCTAQSLKPDKLLAPCKWTQHCWPTTPNIVGSYCVHLHVLWCYKSIYTAMFRRTLYDKAYWIIPWIWLFCTESKGHPNFSKESFWHKTHCFSQIWHNFVDTISFFIFFSRLPQLSTFIFDIKMKIECEGDQYIIEN